MGFLQQISSTIGLIQLIADLVMIALLILIVFHLHSMDEHLKWIRRQR